MVLPPSYDAPVLKKTQIILLTQKTGWKPITPALATFWYWGATLLTMTPTWPGAGRGGATFLKEWRSGTGCCGSCRCSRLITDHTPARGGKEEEKKVMVCLMSFVECILTWNSFAVYPFSDKAQLTFRVLVSEGDCPDSPETVPMNQEISGGFPCKQDEVLQLDSARNIRWMKVNTSSGGKFGKLSATTPATGTRFCWSPQGTVRLFNTVCLCVGLRIPEGECLGK